VTDADSEFREIIAWYEDLLERTFPPTEFAWEPVKIGPTWQYDNGWSLPTLTLGWRVLAWCGVWLRDKNGQPVAVHGRSRRGSSSGTSRSTRTAASLPLGGAATAEGLGQGPAGGVYRCRGDVRRRDVRPLGRRHPDRAAKSRAWVQLVAVFRSSRRRTR
jgi:hypothetical protein